MGNWDCAWCIDGDYPLSKSEADKAHEVNDAHEEKACVQIES